MLFILITCFTVPRLLKHINPPLSSVGLKAFPSCFPISFDISLPHFYLTRRCSLLLKLFISPFSVVPVSLSPPAFHCSRLFLICFTVMLCFSLFHCSCPYPMFHFPSPFSMLHCSLLSLMLHYPSLFFPDLSLFQTLRCFTLRLFLKRFTVPGSPVSLFPSLSDVALLHSPMFPCSSPQLSNI